MSLRFANSGFYTKSTLVFLGISLMTSYIRTYIRRRSLPPGPPCWPIVGTTLQMPQKFLHIALTKWNGTYGPIYSLDLLGQTIIVLGNHRTATDLLDRRSSIYSGRPRLIMASELYTGNLLISSIGYNDVWRRLRRAAHDILTPKASAKFCNIQSHSAMKSVFEMLGNPTKWEQQIDRFASTNLLRSVYGWSASANVDEAIDYIRYTTVVVAKLATPGAHIVEFIPALKHVPAWLAGWKREALEHFRSFTAFFEKLIAEAGTRARTGEAQESMAAQLLDSQEKYGLSNEETAWLAGAMYGAGFDSTALFLRFFVLAMVLHPGVMRKAHAELDEVVGRESVIIFDDLPRLPYIQALVKEILRWSPAAPVGLPHQCTEDDWYEGYFVPKGSTVMPNTWAMNRDPEFYPDFEAFRPERFLEESGPAAAVNQYTHEMGHATFGFGRRVCVGMHFANQGLSIMIATMLWATDIRAPVDGNGVPITPSATDWIDRGVFVAPAPFACAISPRFPEAQAILEATLAAM